MIFKGSHDLARAEEVTTLTLQTLFAVLKQYRVDLKGLILKSSMVIAGSEHSEQTDPATVAEALFAPLKQLCRLKYLVLSFSLAGRHQNERLKTLMRSPSRKRVVICRRNWHFHFPVVLSNRFSRPGIEAEHKAAAQAKLIETLQKELRR
ncbi:MAG: class I fructose-bisphosphate aldolase [Candidatus Paceibacterota bacterium]